MQVLVLLGFWGFCTALLIWRDLWFRNRIRTGDIVGIEFEEDIVLNRTVKNVHKASGELLVLNLKGNGTIRVARASAFLRDDKTPVDTSVKGGYET